MKEFCLIQIVQFYSVDHLERNTLTLIQKIKGFSPLE